MQQQRDLPRGLTRPLTCAAAAPPVPAAAVHARELVDTYGSKMARDIVETNAALRADNGYWRRVLSELATGG